MLSTKIRTAIIATSAVAALAAPSAASALVPVRAITTTAPIRVVQQPPRAAALEAGSAGIPGYDDERCQELLGESLYYETKLGEDIKTAGETSMGTPEHQQAVEASHYDTEVASQDKQELSDNCLVVD